MSEAGLPPVSQAVPAVDDDRTAAIEDRLDRLAGERLEREVQRAGKVLLVVLVLREHLDEWRAGLDEALSSARSTGVGMTGALRFIGDE